MKQSIIYILVLSILMGSFGPYGMAYGDGAVAHTTATQEPATQQPAEPLTKIVVTNPVAVAEAVKNISDEGQTFGYSKDSKANLDKALDSNDEATKSKATWDTLQSMVTAFVILAVGVLRQNAHEENLNMEPANEKALADSIGGLWPAFINVLANVPWGVATYKLNKAMSPVVKDVTEGLFDSSVAQWIAKFIPSKLLMFFSAKAAQKLFKYLVSGGLLSIGSDYVKGFVIFSAQEVLAHPNSFGGVSDRERATLQFLQKQAGMVYFFGSFAYMSAFHYGGNLIPGNMPVLSPEKKLQYEAFYNIDGKVLRAMTHVFEWDTDIRTVLWQHLFRQAFLQGRNGLVIFFSVLSDIVAEMFANKTVAVKGWDKRAFIISVGVGLLASFTPSRVKDIGTSKATRDWAGLQTRYEKWKINRELQNFNYHQSEDGLVRDLSDIFEDERESRENRFVKFAYLAMLSITRTGNLQNEKIKILAVQLKKNQGTLPKPQGTEEWADYVFRQILDPMNAMPPSWSLGWDNSDINYYKGLFQSSISEMMQIYIDESNIYQKISQLNWPPKAQELITGQLKNFQQMEVFVNYMNQILLDQWSTATPDATFKDAQGLLEKISFWGIRESDVLRVFIDGSIVNH